MRTIPLFLTLTLAALICSPASSRAEIGDKVPGCRVIYNASKKQVLMNLTVLEETYQRYRVIEFKIRLFEYERLWKARLQSNDPLSKETRAQGQHEEERLLEELALLDDSSTRASNTFVEGLKMLHALQEMFSSCCPDIDIQDCLGKAFKPVTEKVEEGIEYFGHVFEHEREYRQEVELTIGGRQGLYPEDTVEVEALHTDFYARYEVERRHDRFSEDVWMAHFFQELRKMLTDSFAGDHCCLGCGHTDWEKKAAVIFHG